MKIGIMGIAEREWIDLFKNLEVDIIYQNYKRTASEYARKLRDEDGCNFIVALTHMRVRHDEKFAREIPGIDIVLGGHDHDYHCKFIQHELKGQQSQGASSALTKVVPLIKSATDFYDMSEIDITFEVNEEQFSKLE